MILSEGVVEIVKFIGDLLSLGKSVADLESAQRKEVATFCQSLSDDLLKYASSARNNEEERFYYWNKFGLKVLAMPSALREYEPLSNWAKILYSSESFLYPGDEIPDRNTLRDMVELSAALSALSEAILVGGRDGAAAAKEISETVRSLQLSFRVTGLPKPRDVPDELL